MSDPLTEYIARKSVTDFAAALDKLVTELFVKSAGSSEIIALATQAMMQCIVLIQIESGASDEIAGDREHRQDTIRRLSTKYLTLLQRELNPEAWELFKKMNPEMAAEIEKIL